MTMLAKRRSNRSLTEFACQLLDDFILTEIRDSFQSEQKNTTVRVSIEQTRQSFSVSLFEQEIFRVVLANKRPISLKLSFTSFYDMYGQPSSTTAERLNGLLDRLGYLGIIPSGVRIFRDQEYNTTYLGKGDEKVAIGKGLFTAVHVTPSPERLIFAGFQSSIDAIEDETEET